MEEIAAFLREVSYGDPSFYDPRRRTLVETTPEDQQHLNFFFTTPERR